MNVSLSIFEQLCPSCTSKVSVSAERCACGHVFESAAGNSMESALRDEELYENYLAARAAQAQEAAHAAAAAAADLAGDTDRTAEAELAREVANSIHADLVQQRAKVSALRAALPKRPELARTPAPIETQSATAPAPKPARAPEKRRARLSVPKASPVAAPAKSRPVNPAPATVISVDIVESSVSAAGGEPATMSLSSATRAASVLEAIKVAKAQELAQEEARAQAEQAAQARMHVEHIQSTVPPDTFRAEQTARAEKALAARANPDSKECPNCTASVPTNTTRCRCGYAFVSGRDDLPSLTLCTGDFTALRDSLNLNLRRS